MQNPSSDRPVFSHPLARFVNQRAIAQLLGIQPQAIRQINCWRYVIHVVGKDFCRFVSYGDLPPIIQGDVLTSGDFLVWRKRLLIRRQRHAPSFWLDFYLAEIAMVTSMDILMQWQGLIDQISYLLDIEARQLLLEAMQVKQEELHPVSVLQGMGNR
jgi:hypothetical protein